MEVCLKFIFISVLIGVACCRFLELQNNNTKDESDFLELGNNQTDFSHESECNCNWKYFKHYEIKNCTIEQVDNCGCPKKFSCSQALKTSLEVCVYQNKEYSVGSKIATSNACQVCRCRNGSPPYLSCIHKDCPELPSVPGRECHLVYEENRCCPVSHQCIYNESEDEITSNETCEYNSQLYPYGSKIYPVDDPCKVCICNENWNGVDNSSCYQHDCILEQSKSKLDFGCIPVYHENRCCPIEFYCPSSHKFTYSILSSNKTENNETSVGDGDQCIFGNNYYDIGYQLFLDNPCVMCHCLVPPDFTCIHQSCPPSPSDKNCYPIHSKEECCPSYECLYGDAEPETETEACPTPLCADSSCHIMIPPGHECPTCICGERVSELEHNEVQQQVQQINQNEEPYQLIGEGPIYVSNDYSEDELQLMPIRNQDTEQITDSEKMVLPELNNSELYPNEDFIELEDELNETNFSPETVNTAAKEALNEQNPEINSESELEDSYIELNSTQTEKEVQKRSNREQRNTTPVQGRPLLSQIQMKYKDLEREGEPLQINSHFDDELESFTNKINKNSTIINEIFSINHEVEVPAGCPTPLCEGSWCKIGIPPGHRCPTCICTSHVDTEP